MKKTKANIQNQMLYPNKVYLNHTLGTSQTVETTAAQMSTNRTTVASNAQAENLAATETVSTQYAWMESLRGKVPLKHENNIVPCSPEILLSHPKLKPHRNTFVGSQLHISRNALRTFEGDTQEQPGWMNGYAKPLHYITQLIDGRYVLIDSDEAATVLKKPKSVQLLWLVGHGPLIVNSGWTISNAFKNMEAQAKLLEGL
jgi:hypothetical protein